VTFWSLAAQKLHFFSRNISFTVSARVGKFFGNFSGKIGKSENLKIILNLKN